MSIRPERWTVLNFSQSNGAGPGQGDVPALLRCVADTIQALGDVTVQDIVFRSEVTDGEDDISLTVYYHDMPRARRSGGSHRWFRPLHVPCAGRRR